MNDISTLMSGQGRTPGVKLIVTSPRVLGLFIYELSTSLGSIQWDHTWSPNLGQVTKDGLSSYVTTVLWCEDPSDQFSSRILIRPLLSRFTFQPVRLLDQFLLVQGRRSKKFLIIKVSGYPDENVGKFIESYKNIKSS